MNLKQMSTETSPSRRSVIKCFAAAAVLPYAMADTGEKVTGRVAVNGKINHSVSKWCYTSGEKGLSLQDLCSACAKMGIQSIELLGATEIEVVKKYGLTCAIVSAHGIKKGMNRRENHAACIQKIKNGIDVAAELDCPGTISFSGNREGLDDEDGIKIAVEGYKKVAGYAEKKGVTINIEYLNSKVNHKDYMFDNMRWGVEVCKQVGSERLKILYDIYHAQIMEGDIIRTIRDYHDYIGHYHTGGVPGRNEIDDTQELYYPAIMKAIVDTGYRGFVGQEFVPTREPLTSLAAAIRICDV